MSIEIQDTEGRAAAVEVAHGPAECPPRVGIRIAGPSAETSWSCTPAAARELAAALTLAAGEAEGARSAQPVTVQARELVRGDVRDGDRLMTVEGVRTEGATTQVTWRSGGGRSWTQSYAADAAITLRRRLLPGA